MAASGGIVGRGVLLDYAGFAIRHHISLSPFSPSGIPLSHLQGLVEEQGSSFLPGDILFIRSGFTAAYDALLPEEQAALAAREKVEFAGIEATLDVAEWLWECEFAAVAGDAVAWESVPLGSAKTTQRVGKEDVDGKEQISSLHQWLLAGWGMPIGEMFDLEELAKHCERERRWTFFMSSVPLKVSRLSYAYIYHERKGKFSASSLILLPQLAPRRNELY